MLLHLLVDYMIVPCPACHIRFNVNINALSDAGRKVRCTKCGEIWHQMPTKKVSTLSIRPGENKGSSIADGKFNQDGEDDNADKLDIENLQNSKNDMSSHSISQSKKEISPNEKTNNEPRAADSGGGWVGWLFFIVVLGGLCGGGYLYHARIIEIWPPVGPLFEMIGLGPEKASLAIQNVSWAYEKEDDKLNLAVEGEVINNSQKSQSVPRLLLVVLDDKNQHLFRWTATTIKKHLDSGHVTKFSTRLTDPPDGVKSIAVTLQIQK